MECHKRLGDVANAVDYTQPSGDVGQQEVLDFLQDPKTYGLGEPVVRIDTHGAVVFLAGPNVFKVKRAVHYDYMNFSTLALREQACRAEMRVNQDNAAGLYLGVVPIKRDSHGALNLGGAGVAVEWAVHLKRFDEEATLDRLAARGEISPALIDALACLVVNAHRLAPMRDPTRAFTSFRQQIEQTLSELASGTDVFPALRAKSFAADITRSLDDFLPLLFARGVAGQCRRCHGDLHLGNVILIHDVPVLFDALEFDEDLATGDVLYDLAFLVMDFCKHGLLKEANRLLNGYLSTSADQALQIDGLAALPLFLSVRAAIRAKVAAEAYRHEPAVSAMRELAVTYFTAAAEFIAPACPRLIAIGGLSGSGKTRLAATIAPEFGRKPGAIHLRSDIVRKHMAGASATTRLSPDLYEPGPSAAVYLSLNELAGRALRASQVVIADATYLKVAQRQEVAKIAQYAGVPFHGLWLDAPLSLRTERIAARRGDASDATAVVAAAQDAGDPGTMDWTRLDASQSFGQLVHDALASLQ